MADKAFGLHDVVEMKSPIHVVPIGGRSFVWAWISVLNVKAADTA